MSPTPHDNTVSGAEALARPSGQALVSDQAPTGLAAPRFDPSRICVDEGEHGMCGCIVVHAREIMQHWCGSNCTWVDDDITALGILAGHAIRAGLHHGAAIPASLVRAIDRHVAEAAIAKAVQS